MNTNVETPPAVPAVIDKRERDATVVKTMQKLPGIIKTTGPALFCPRSQSAAPRCQRHRSGLCPHATTNIARFPCRFTARPPKPSRIQVLVDTGRLSLRTHLQLGQELWQAADDRTSRCLRSTKKLWNPPNSEQRNPRFVPLFLWRLSGMKIGSLL